MRAAGWHGKLPTLGDFATRRLDAGFVQVWDAWLSAGLAGLARMPGWLDAYLAGPVWRFVLMPGALPAVAGSAAGAWAGVLMPSVDRVGRYYPLTLTHTLDGAPADAHAVGSLLHWLAALDDAAADALHEDWTIDALEAALERIGSPPEPSAPPAGALPDTAAVLAVQAAALWHGTMRGRAFWHAAAGPGAPRLLASSGLPPELPAQLFGVPAAAAPAPTHLEPR